MSSTTSLAIPWQRALSIILPFFICMSAAGCGENINLKRAKADLAALEVTVTKDGLPMTVTTMPVGFVQNSAYRQFQLSGSQPINADYELSLKSPRINEPHLTTLQSPPAGKPAGVWSSRVVYGAERDDCGYDVSLEQFGSGPLLVRVEETCGLPPK